eukprot:TRINITY_DN9148_c0_g2_i1.p1 TRINITY_DN9148_c0_g2~~TRINITY_DN9148_c0_g2_i1.p1  ORF type:complete len:330 (+),score=48.76 TRINITY_DN9148_c0_g2_i1:141-992(+)
MPTMHMTPFSPPRKKLRLPSFSGNPDFPIDVQLPAPPSFSGNPPLLSIPDNNTPAGIQGARHAQFGISLSDLHLNKLQSNLFPPPRISNGLILGNPVIHDNVSCLLTIGNSSQISRKSDEGKTPQFLLFGQPILTEQQISLSCSGNSSSNGNNPEKTAYLSDGSGSTNHHNSPPENSSSEGFMWYKDRRAVDLSLETGHCKVFMESEDVGRTLDLSVLGSYEELYRRLANMFGIERSEMLTHVLYRDAMGTLKNAGDEPFGDFMKTARRLTILTDSGRESLGR